MTFRTLFKVFAAGGILVFLGFGALVFFTIRHQQHYRDLPDSHDLKDRIIKMGEGYIAKRPSGGLVIGVIQKGKSELLTFGRSSPTNSAPPDGETLYEIGSVTKVLTAITLARMVNEGSVSLDDPISKFLPKDVACPQLNGRQITLKDLATHTAGLPRLPDNLQETVTNDANPYVNYHVADLYKGVSMTRLTKEPGTKSSYSNFGVGLLGHIISLKAGKPYEEMVQMAVLSPVAMSNTAIHLAPAQEARFMIGYSPKGKETQHWELDALAGCGAFRSCVNDLLKFVLANLGPLDSDAGKALALAQKVYFSSFVGSVGLGWQIRELTPDQMIHWHNGGTGGFVSFVGFGRGSQVGVVILSNYGDAEVGDSSVDKMGMEILQLAPRISWD